VVLEFRSRIEKSLHFHYTHDVVERAELAAHDSDQVERCRAREAVTVVCGELASESAFGQLAVFRQRRFPCDEQQIAGAHRVGIVRRGGAAGRQRDAKFLYALFGVHVIAFLCRVPASRFTAALAGAGKP
jgi:hypothetical protein